MDICISDSNITDARISNYMNICLRIFLLNLHVPYAGHYVCYTVYSVQWSVWVLCFHFKSLYQVRSALILMARRFLPGLSMILKKKVC